MRLVPETSFKHVLLSWVKPSIALWIVSLTKALIFLKVSSINPYLGGFVLLLISYLSVGLSRLQIRRREDM